MLHTLGHILALDWLRSGGRFGSFRRIPRLRLDSLSDHDIADLNLPPEMLFPYERDRRRNAIRGR